MQKMIDDIDTNCRDEFGQRLIVGENDYSSILSYKIRKLWTGPGSIRYHCARRTTSKEEQAFGADILVQLRNRGFSKLVWFEAKSARPQWDYMVTFQGRRESHFQSQLDRQMRAERSGCGQFFTIFYVPIPNGHRHWNLRPDGSTVFVSNMLGRLHGSQAAWTPTDISTLSPNIPKLSIGYVIEQHSICKYGKPIRDSDLKGRIGDIGQRPGPWDIDDPEQADPWMQQLTGVNHYYDIDVSGFMPEWPSRLE